MRKRFIFGAVLIAPLIAFAVPPEVHAGKLMRFARWGAREAVKAALVTYAKHEVGENFEPFKQKFCTDKSYRQQVLSSPTIAPLIADQASAEDLVVETLGCGFAVGKINVAFTDAVPGNFEHGNAKNCEVKATAYNYSKYHLDQLTIDLDGWKVSVGDLVANAYADIQIPSFNLGANGKCSNSAKWLNDHAKEAGALQCSVPNMAEGDCQELISVSSAIDMNKVIALEEEGARQEEAKQVEEHAKQVAEQAARDRTARRDRVYWNKVLRAFYFANPAISGAFEIVVWRSTEAIKLERILSSPDRYSNEYEVTTKKEIFQPCTFFNLNSKVELEERYKLPRIPDGYVIGSRTDGGRYGVWIVKEDDMMPNRLYFSSPNMRSCKPSRAGLEFVFDAWVHTTASGQATVWIPEPLRSIQW
jgi:hypothetical protein